MQVKDEIEEKLEAMEKEPESKTEDKAEAAGAEDGKVKEDFNAAEAISAPAVTSEYTVDEKVRVEYIPQGKINCIFSSKKYVRFKILFM